MVAEVEVADVGEEPVRPVRMEPPQPSQVKTGDLGTLITLQRGAVEPTGNGAQVHTIAVIELCAPGGIG